MIEFVNGGNVKWRKLLRVGDEATKKQFAFRRYDAAIALEDQCVEEIIDFLREAHVWNDTLLILTADHGEVYRATGGIRIIVCK